VLTNITVAEYEGSTPLTLKPAVEHDPNWTTSIHAQHQKLYP
jgi:hypothetical protein